MLVSKKKYNKLKEDYDYTVKSRDYWEEAYRHSQMKVCILEGKVNRLTNTLNKKDDEVLKLTIKINELEEMKW